MMKPPCWRGLAKRAPYLGGEVLHRKPASSMGDDGGLLRTAGLSSALEALWTPVLQKGRPGYLLHNRTVLARIVAATLPYLSKPPPAPIVTAERPTPLEVRCEGPLWAGRRAQPAEIVDVFMFAWQLDLLEVRLFELEHVVDSFVVWEGMFGQRGIEKPLVLAANMHRFARFRHKISCARACLPSSPTTPPPAPPPPAPPLSPPAPSPPPGTWCRTTSTSGRCSSRSGRRGGSARCGGASCEEAGSR